MSKSTKSTGVRSEPYHCSLCGGGRGHLFGYVFDPNVVNKFGEAKYVCKCRAEYEELKAKRTADLELPIPRAEKDALRHTIKFKYPLTKREHPWSWKDDLDQTNYPGMAEFEKQYA